MDLVRSRDLRQTFRSRVCWKDKPGGLIRVSNEAYLHNDLPSTYRSPMTPVQLNSTKKKGPRQRYQECKREADVTWFRNQNACTTRPPESTSISSLYQIIRTSEHIARLGKKGSRPNPLPLLRTAMPTETGYLQSEVSLNKASRADAHNLHRCLRSSRIAGLHMGTNIQHRKRIKLIHILLPAH
jgi:hypothetical protein